MKSHSISNDTWQLHSVQSCHLHIDKWISAFPRNIRKIFFPKHVTWWHAYYLRTQFVVKQVQIPLQCLFYSNVGCGTSFLSFSSSCIFNTLLKEKRVLGYEVIYSCILIVLLILVLRKPSGIVHVLITIEITKSKLGVILSYGTLVIFDIWDCLFILSSLHWKGSRVLLLLSKVDTIL